MIDVHIITLPTDDDILLQQCLDSLKDEPVTIHLIQGVVGDARVGRIAGLSKGTHKWVSWVDPDDFIIPGAYQRLLDIVGDKKFAWSAEEVWTMDSTCSNALLKQVNNNPHHMMIIDRSLIDFEHIKRMHESADTWVKKLAQQGVFDPTVGYVWRSYSNFAAERFTVSRKAAQPIVSTVETISDALSKVYSVIQNTSEFIWLNRKDAHRIDCHILVHHSLDNPEALYQCISSLINQPMNILLVVDRTDGNTHMGSMRHMAFSMCTAEFVAFVDDDDYMVADITADALSILDNSPGIVGIYTGVQFETNKGTFKVKPFKPWTFESQVENVLVEVGHFHMFRSAPVKQVMHKLDDWDTAEEAFLMLELVRFGDWWQIPTVAYSKRTTFGGAGSRIESRHMLELGRIIRQLRAEFNISSERLRFAST